MKKWKLKVASFANAIVVRDYKWGGGGGGRGPLTPSGEEPSFFSRDEAQKGERSRACGPQSAHA
jgi:hypothetical protein